MASESILREPLIAQLGLLENQLAAIEATQQETAGIAFGKRIGEGTSLAVDRLNQLAIHEKLTKQHRDVQRALAKIDDGSHGRCDECGAEIESARLEALPWAAHCRSCATTVDRSVEARRPERPASRPAAPSESPWDAVLRPSEPGDQH